MSQGKKLIEYSKEEIIEKFFNLVDVYDRSRRDLPDNVAANKRHQLSKRIWADKKKRMISLLRETLGFIPAGELSDRINHEINKEEIMIRNRDSRSYLKRKRSEVNKLTTNK